MNKTGRVTLPAQSGLEKEVLALAEKWGIDAVRDSDGTRLSEEITAMGFQVYSTLCLIREDNEWAKAHPEYRQQMYLSSQSETAVAERLDIDILKYYFKEQFEIDTRHDPHLWWEVTDRTTGKPLDASCWNFDPGTDRVSINGAEKWHRYTVSFLVYQNWEPVSMYNHITNAWKEGHRLPLDPRHPEARRHLLEVLDRWLKGHPQTDVVRFTTFFYNFDLIYDEKGKERQVDWFGYLSCVSPLALEMFKQEYGYGLKPEDFIDQGHYNTPFKAPSGKMLDWMDFNQRFVAGLARECVDRVHRAGKKAIMFLGDHWTGTEPYGKYFGGIGLDAVVGAAGDGVTTRMITDIPVKATEVRFYPYLFPDVFFEGGNPVKETLEVWRKSRRALLRRPAERMGYGGYLSLAVKFPDFVENVAGICREFRAIHEKTKGAKPYSASFKVGILNAWGGLRSWMTHQIAHSLWNRRCYSYLGILEALSGLPFDVEFLSFNSIKKEGVPAGMGVIINAGDAGTAWSGGEVWKDARLVTAVREWVYGGGGFIGVGEPSACEDNGGFFQLFDVLGVQKETGLTLSHKKPEIRESGGHFITDGLTGDMDFGEGMDSIYLCGEVVQVLKADKQGCALAANTYGKGRAVYMSGLPFNTVNTRLLSRALFWCAGREGEMLCWHSENPAVECTAYPEAGCFVAVNNSDENQESVIVKADGSRLEVKLPPMGYEWMEV